MAENPEEKRPLPQEIVYRLYEHGRMGREARDKGDLAEAERQFLAGWAAIPEPKLEHDYAQSWSRGMVEFFRDTKQNARAKEWLGVTREAYGPGPNVSVEFLAATVHYEADELEKAFSIFDALHREWGQRPFQGKDKKFLAFYKERRAKKGKGDGSR